MTGTGTATSDLATTWRAHVLDTAAIHDELNRLWGELGGSRAPSNTGQAEGVVARANTLNLVTVAESAEEAGQIQETILRLSDFYPSRSIILVADSEHREPTEEGMDVRVALLEPVSGKGRRPIRLECVTIETDSATATHLASIVSPLLVAELPDFLWWHGRSVPGTALFDDLADAVDRLVVDTATLTAPGHDLQVLAELVRRPHGRPKLSDFAWSRLTPWRSLIAQFFDVATAQPCLDCLEEITIGYAAPQADGRSGFSCGLLLAGWLATRLGWQSPGELVRAGESWRLTLRSGRPGRRREVKLSLRPIADAPDRVGLHSVTLSASEESAGSFTIERLDQRELTTASETSSAPRVSRMVFSQPPNQPALLGGELQQFGRDLVFEQALSFAASLIPEGANA